ncbi:MAG TPA: ATP-binding protein [Thermoanaerobaculia bacterium]|jgi:AAA+ ATPase superfamily predicted ATPase|nr:ATP-binding protein [Thermoanaerobaculia bacterium]
MIFVDRQEELARLDRVAASEEGGLVVVYGRRRVGKTRLLLEWTKKHAGVYTVADQSVAELQRRYFAEALGGVLSGFAEVDYPDWRSLLSRVAREAQLAGWRGPLIFDELPYLVLASPELPSVLQRWVDHDARAARLAVAVAGSSQRMMQGFVLAGDAPLFGRAREILDIQPLPPAYLRDVFPVPDGVRHVELHTAWGGIPRYWELALDAGDDVQDQVDRLVLDPLGPLHREPDRLLLEEIPSALETRPLLDAIGAGAHRVSEIAGRLGRPATSMARPLERLLALGLVRRELPFGEDEKSSKRALYKIADPFFRLWFRVVAPYRAQLASGTPAARRQVLTRFWDSLCAQAWEELCRQQIPRLPEQWGPASRWWHGAQPEWDVVSESLDGTRVLLGEAKWSAKPFDRRPVEAALRELAAKPAPPLPSRLAGARLVRALFVPEIAGKPDLAAEGEGLMLITAADLLDG